MTTATQYSAEQQRVISLDGGAYLVTAPPGSGKTQILVERSIRLLDESAGGSFRILALTFTTRAADELRERVAAGVADEWQRMTTCTFHAFALDVLRHYGERIGVGPALTVFESQDDRLESLAQALADEGYDVGRSPDDLRVLRAVLAEISLLKRRLVPAEAAPTTEVQGVRLDVAYQAHARKLRQLGAVDFDDLLLLANQLLAEHPGSHATTAGCTAFFSSTKRRTRAAHNMSCCAPCSGRSTATCSWSRTPIRQSSLSQEATPVTSSALSPTSVRST